MSRLAGLVLNLSIGAKLGIASLLSILLVGGMIYVQMTGNAAVRTANENMIRLQTVLSAAAEAKASMRGMQIGVRDARLAGTPDALQKAGDYLAARHKRADGFAEQIQKLARSPEQIQLIEKLRADIGRYAAEARQILTVRAEAVSIEAKRASGGELSSDAVAKLTKLNDEAGRLAREVTLPIAAELEESANKIVEFSKARAEEQAALTVREMSSAERNGMVIGVVAALMLVVTCIFSVFTIARPMKALTGAMKELADGNFGVVLPGLGRKDEIGGVAEAVEAFKIKAEQKAHDEAEAKIHQDHAPPSSARPRWSGSPTRSSRRSAGSSRPCPRPPPNSRPPPER